MHSVQQRLPAYSKNKSNGNQVMLLSNWTSHLKLCAKKSKNTGEQPEINTFLQLCHRDDKLTSNGQQRKSLDQTNTTAGKVDNNDTCPVVSPQHDQQPFLLLLDSQDSQLTSPQPMVPQHCQYSTTLPILQDVDNLSAITDLQNDLQPTIAVIPQLLLSTHDAEQPPPVQPNSKGIQQSSTAKTDFSYLLLCW